MSKKTEISFEEALLELQKIVDAMESGNAPLEKSLEAFERGTELVKICNAHLDRAEQRVSMVTAGEGGVTLSPFEGGNA